jgi:hypothetical protein
MTILADPSIEKRRTEEKNEQEVSHEKINYRSVDPIFYIRRSGTRRGTGIGKDGQPGG